MANILEQMVEDGYTSEGELDRAVRLVAQVEVLAEQGKLDLDPDELAAARHLLMEPVFYQRAHEEKAKG